MFDIDWRNVILMLPSLLFGFAIHEFAHARVAVAFGDDTPRRQGRLTLSPIPHIDPIGLLLFVFAGFGWAKPVEINPNAFRNPRRDDLLVSAAGPLSNLTAALVFALLTRLLPVFNPSIYLDSMGTVLFEIISYFVWTNLIMAFFNLIPIPPLDGSHILFDVLPSRFERYKDTFFKFGAMALIAIVLIENSSKMDILPIGPMVRWSYNHLFEWLGVWRFAL